MIDQRQKTDRLQSPSQSSSLSDDQSATDDTVIEFDSRWQDCDKPPDIDAFLDEQGEAHNTALLIDLILVDQENRWRRDDHCELRDYMSRYGARLAADADVLSTFLRQHYQLAVLLARDPCLVDYLSGVNADDQRRIFWEFVKIDMSKPANPGLDDYRHRYRERFGSDPVVPNDIVVRQFERDWESGKDPSIDNIVEDLPTAVGDSLLEQLVEIDMTGHWRRGEPRWLECYLEKYSSLIDADGYLPASLVALEKRLSLAVRIGHRQVRCPCCQHVQAANEIDGSCTNCGRALSRSGGEIHIPDRIDDFQVIKRLGIGGYGVVYKCWSRHLRAMVAVKIPRASLLSVDGFRRFKREVSVVSSLRHPNIVRILSSHITENPRESYIVFAYIDGPVLSRAACAEAPDIGRIVELLRAIADAVHFAHRKRVVHRDLKPDNILLDKQGNPYVSDFGLARLTRLTSTEGTTTQDMILGSPEYMSPEQIRGEAVDYRTDIYSIGVILHKLLTGSVPFTGVNLFELKRKIESDSPIPLSRIRPSVPRELEKMCLRLLQKSPSKRYATVHALARDLRRFQAGKPVRARPPSPLVRLFLWYRWRRLRAVVHLSMTLLPVLSFVLAYNVWRERQIRADRETVHTARVTRAWTKYYDTLARQISGDGASNYPVSFDDDRFQQTLRYIQRLSLDPDLQRTQEVLAEFERGDYRSVAQYLRNLGDTAETRFHLGNIYYLVRDYGNALNLYQSALQAGDENTIERGLVMRNMASCCFVVGQYKNAVDYLGQALADDINRYGDDAPELAENWIALGDVYYYWGNYPRSLDCFQRAYELDQRRGDIAQSDIARDLDRLGGVMHALGKYRQAIDYFRRALEIEIDHYGPDHENVARDWWHLGGPYYSMGDYREAANCFRNALTIYQKLYGRVHPMTSRAFDLLGGALFDLGEADQALACFHEALAIDMELYADQPLHSNLARDYNHIGGVLLGQKKYREAIAYIRKGFEIDKRHLPPDHPEIARNYIRFGIAWLGLEKFNRARAYFESALIIDQKAYPPKHSVIADDYQYLARSWLGMGNLERARACALESTRIYQETFDDDHPKVLAVNDLLSRIESVRRENSK